MSFISQIPRSGALLPNGPRYDIASLSNLDCGMLSYKSFKLLGESAFDFSSSTDAFRLAVAAVKMPKPESWALLMSKSCQIKYVPLEFSSPIQREAIGSSVKGLSKENLDLLTNSDMLLLPGFGKNMGWQ
jgi:hypothetical protein